MLKCGAAEACITPPMGLYIPGYFEWREGTGVKSDLYAHALAVENGGKTAILISVDIIVMGKNWTRTIRKGIAERIGVVPEAVMVSATHTHTGGPFDGTDWNGKSDAGYRKTVIDTCVSLAVKAYENRVPATMGFGEGEERRISFCRNYRMKDGQIRTNPSRVESEIVEPLSPIDYSVGVLRFDDAEGKTIAEVVNFACHPDTVGGTEICADYPGEMRRLVKEEIGRDTVILFLNGCCGNINHIDFMRRKKDPGVSLKDPDHYKWMGKCLSETVTAVNRTIKTNVKDAKVAYASKCFRATRRQPTEKDIAWADEILATADAKWNDQTYAKGLYDMRDNPQYFSNVEVQAISVGDVAFVGFPCEPFNDIGTRVKENSPFAHNMMAELSNGHYGYWVTEPAFSGGPKVYEARLARDNSAFAPSEAAKMEALAGKLLETIYHA